MTRYITVWLPPERPCCASHAYVLPEQRHHDENGKDLEALEYTGVRHVIARAGLANLSDKMGYQCASSDRHMHLPMLDGKTSEAESVRRGSHCNSRAGLAVIAELLIDSSWSAVTRPHYTWAQAGRANRNVMSRSVPNRAFAVLAQHVVECLGHQRLKASALATCQRVHGERHLGCEKTGDLFATLPAGRTRCSPLPARLVLRLCNRL